LTKIMTNHSVFIKLSLTIALLLGVLISYGQTTFQLDKDTSKFKDLPLYIINVPQQSPVETFYINGFNPHSYESIKVDKNPDLVSVYGKKALNGIVTIGLKKGTKLLSFKQLLTANYISGNDRNLPVFIDSAIAYQPINTYFEPAMIKSVKIDTDLNTGTKYINIRSISALPKKGEIYIRGNATGIKFVD
jgi:hypothetical protein